MSVRHHPGEEYLLAYAAGASDEAMSLLVATHLAFCPSCRRTVAQMEGAGGATLLALQPAAMSERALELAMAELDRPAPPPKPRVPQAEQVRAENGQIVPEPLRSYVGGDISRGWIPIGPGIAYRPLMKRGSTRARLIRTVPGKAVPEHTHRGNELTLILTGGLSDVTGHYRAGDVQSTTPDVTHEPCADPDDICLNLAVTDAPLVFRTPIPRLVGKVFGF